VVQKIGETVRQLLREESDPARAVRRLLASSKPEDAEALKDYLRYEYSQCLLEAYRTNVGAYYTPKHLVDLVRQVVRPHLTDNSYVLDLSAGCGAFLDGFPPERTAARDVDERAVQILKALGFSNVAQDNSLVNVSRTKYGLSQQDHLVIVGNPPYNDTTSKNKRALKVPGKIAADPDIATNDYGISFLRTFCKLRADVICVLHPLSYLIKPANFRKLGLFTHNYRLRTGIIFSSEEFSDTRHTPFPVMCALYVRASMDYEYVRTFPFDILREPKKFVLSKAETIDGYIRKYPPSKDIPKKSNIGLYMYNIRDTNSLLTSGNLTEKENFACNITVNFCDLYKYAYLNCMKRYFGKHYLFGNLSPIVRKSDLENSPFFRNLFIIDAIVNNQNLATFNVRNRRSIVFTQGLLETYHRNAKSCSPEERFIYRAFVNFVEGKEVAPSATRSYIQDYFERLRESMTA
jgi:hypothetical protein